MHTLIRRCKECGVYTLHDRCHICGGETIEVLPPRFSPEDRYGKYRRMLKKEVRKWNQ
jgi:H/ACA ribonucleoprotein complex subunit 3